MAYRKSMSRSGSRKNFRRNTPSRKVNHKMGSRGGIRL